MSQLYSLFLSPGGKQVWRARLEGLKLPQMIPVHFHECVSGGDAVKKLRGGGELSRASERCEPRLTCCSGPAAMDMRRLQAVNRAEPMSWRLGIVTPSMLWERLAWTERLASQMDETRQRVTPWAFCQVAWKTVDTTDSKSYTVADVQRVLGIVL